MKNDNLIYDWLDFLAEQKISQRKLLVEQQTYKASVSNPGAAQAFGDFDYVMASGDSVKVVSNPIPMTKVNLFCTAQNRVIGSVNFHSRFAANLEKAYREGSTRYCPTAAGGFNPRKVRSPRTSTLPVEQRPLSNHSFGTAVDFNPGKNPYKAGFTSEMESYPEFIEAFEKNGFRWLGDGVGRSGPGHPGDDMHFDINYNATPGEFQDATTETHSEFSEESVIGDILGITSKPATKPVKESKEKRNKSIFKIKDNKDKIFDKHKKYFVSLLNYIKEKLDLTREVKIVFEDDEKNSKVVLGRTGGYLNQQNKIHIFVTGRHIKDILRSLAHELVHHKQNIRGEFNKSEPTSNGYAQKNPHLRKMEKEAFLKGNMLFRDWEDNYKYRGVK